MSDNKADAPAASAAMGADGNSSLRSAEEKGSEAKSSRLRFSLVFLSMCLVSFACALDSTIIVTAFPTISQALGASSSYVWVANAYVVACTAVQPLVGRLSDVFGRRWPFLISTALFILGNGVAGGASSVAMLIAGRIVQGLGGGGIFVLVDIVTCDLVPMRQRGQYLSIMLSASAVGTTIGPVIGGAIAEANWSWVFYLNALVAAVALIVMIPFLKLKRRTTPSFTAALTSLDLVGNIIFMPSIISLLLGLIMGGTVFAWNTWHVIVPIVLGACGWAAFHAFEASSLCKQPTMPTRLFSNRTSALGLLLSSIAAALLQWEFYFLPVYFEGVKLRSPLKAGVDLLPSSLFLLLFAMAAGGIMTKTGRYRPIHWVGFAFLPIGFGLFSLLDATSSTAAWTCFQLLAALGLGATMTTLLPAIQASLPEGDVASATGAYAFVRSFGFVWGITVPSVIFNNRIDAQLDAPGVDDALRSALADGHAYAFAAAGSVTPQGRAGVQTIFELSLRDVWYAAAAFAGLACILSFFTRHVKLRTELETEYGLEDGERGHKASDPEG